MTISTRIRSELFTSQSGYKTCNDAMQALPQLIRLPLTRSPDRIDNTCNRKKKAKRKTAIAKKDNVKARETPHRHGLPWTTDEHDRFLQGLELYPSGPWKAIASYVGTRTPRQTMTHAQKYRQKIQRRHRKLMMSSRQSTSAAHSGIVITTNVKDQVASSLESPKAVDRPLDIDEQATPLQSNWFDKVELGELAAAFQAFLEVYGPALFPMDDEEQVNTLDYDFAMTESIVL